MGSEVHPILEAVRKAADEGEAVDAIYQGVDELLRAGSFHEVDDLLASFRVGAATTLQLLAFASITTAARRLLSARPDFIARVRECLTERDQASADALLAGLE
jgi:hypothetical protein